MKILAVVKFNDGEAFVLDETPKLIYTKHDANTIIGTDGTFYNFYSHQHDKYAKAFAGRKFTLPLDTGEVVECSGQWWDGITQTAIDVLGINKTDKRIIYATAASLDDLKKCYVFYGYKALPEPIAALRKTYTGPVWEYWDYQCIVRGKKIPKKRLRKMRNILNKRLPWYKN